MQITTKTTKQNLIENLNLNGNEIILIKFDQVNETLNPKDLRVTNSMLGQMFLHLTSTMELEIDQILDLISFGYLNMFQVIAYICDNNYVIDLSKLQDNDLLCNHWLIEANEIENYVIEVRKEVALMS